MRTTPEKSPPLSTATLHILLALAGGDLHGYGIIQEVARHSDGHYRMGPGTLYDNLKKLMNAGLVAHVQNSGFPGQEEKRLYTLTTDGRNCLSLEVDRLADVIKEASQRLRRPRPA